jgi:hypothetical protein
MWSDRAKSPLERHGDVLVSGSAPSRSLWSLDVFLQTQDCRHPPDIGIW